jgi:Uma2 family endonuclease
MTSSVTSNVAMPELDAVPTADIAGSLFRMTVDQYERLVSTGFFDGDAVELINGLLVKRMGKNPPHSWTVEALREAIGPLLAPGWSFRQEQPLAIPFINELEPDLVIVSGSRDDYLNRHPIPDDVALLVEVADSTLERDRGAKLLAYSRGGVQVYWIVNLIDGQLELYTRPSATGYTEKRVIDSNGEAALLIDGKECGRIRVGAILPNVEARP